jgi:hypothetical protein
VKLPEWCSFGPQINLAVLRRTAFYIMTNTQSYARRELDILVKSLPDPDNRPIIEPFIPEILALCEKFGNSGQSGGSAPFTASALSMAIKKLCLQEPICDITGIDDEWTDTSDMADGTIVVYQNKRCSALFKETIEGKPYYLDAVIFKNQKGVTWSSNNTIMKDGSRLRSRQYIKGFPFKPKTFYIDVIEEEVEKDDWVFFIKNERQLNSVWKYYDRYDK